MKEGKISNRKQTMVMAAGGTVEKPGARGTEQRARSSLLPHRTFECPARRAPAQRLLPHEEDLVSLLLPHLARAVFQLNISHASRADQGPPLRRGVRTIQNDSLKHDLPNIRPPLGGSRSTGQPTATTRRGRPWSAPQPRETTGFERPISPSSSCRGRGRGRRRRSPRSRRSG